MNLFGWEIKRPKEEEAESFVEKTDEDGALSVSSVLGGSQGLSLNLDETARSEAELVTKYRTMLNQHEVNDAVDEIVNESINVSFDKSPVKLVLDELEYSDKIKERIEEEFNYCLNMLDFTNRAYDIFQKWYVDGRLNYHIIIDEKNRKGGIKELRYIDPRKIKKVKEYEDVPLEGSTNINVKRVKDEYYLYSEIGFGGIKDTTKNQYGSIEGLKIRPDSIAYCNSGIVNEMGNMVLSHLHRAYKPLNQLKIMEDASVVYRISRAPERRVFYIDVGRLPPAKAEQHLRNMMAQHKNKVVYNSATGELADDRRVMTITDDFWFSRKEGSQSTQVENLQGGANLGEMDDILYFQKQLFKSLGVPISRLDADTSFDIGRSSQITRDEIKFAKFVRRLRNRFSKILMTILEKQLILKGVVKQEDWDKVKNLVRFNFQTDNHFEEFKEAEILTERFGILDRAENYSGKFYSKEWLWKNVLKLTETEIEEMKKEIEQEAKDNPPPEDDKRF